MLLKNCLIILLVLMVPFSLSSCAGVQLNGNVNESDSPPAIKLNTIFKKQIQLTLKEHLIKNGFFVDVTQNKITGDKNYVTANGASFQCRMIFNLIDNGVEMKIEASLYVVNSDGNLVNITTGKNYQGIIHLLSSLKSSVGSA